MVIRTKSLYPFYLFFVLLIYLARNNGFFWDSIVVGSMYAHWYFDTNFQKLFVPEAIAGYPPLFGVYLALGWKICGKSLLVSHGLILPFLIGIVVETHKLVTRFIHKRYHFWVLLIVLIEPTFLAQATQVSPDIILVYLYLYSLNSLFTDKRKSLAIALVLLALLSPRGTIMVVALFVTDIFINRKLYLKTVSLKQLLKIVTAYLPAFLITCFWIFIHFQHFGWVFYNHNSAWGQGGQLVNAAGFIKNLIVIAWRYADFGKAIVFVLLIVIFLKLNKITTEALTLLGLAIIPCIVLSSIIVFYQNPIAHRYYIVSYLLLLLFFGHILQYVTQMKRIVYYSLSILCLIVGHFTVMLYPAWLSKGWDGTLAHVPYFELRENMIDYINSSNLQLNEIGSAYPNLRSFELTELNNRSASFPEKDLQNQTYVLYSNIYNDFSDEELDELKSNWRIIKEYKKQAVQITLYRKN